MQVAGGRHRGRKRIIIVVLVGVIGAIAVSGFLVLNTSDKRPRRPFGPELSQLTGDVALDPDAPATCHEYAASPSLRTLPRSLPGLLVEGSAGSARRSVMRAADELSRIPDQPADLQAAATAVAAELRSFAAAPPGAADAARVGATLADLSAALQKLCDFPL